MNLVFGHDQTIADWVSNKTNGKPFVLPCKAFGLVDKEGTLIGGCVFTGVNDKTLELSLAGPATFTRTAWRAIISYVFEQNEYSRLQMHVSQRNKQLLRMLAPLRKSGVKFENVSEWHYGENHNAVCFSLTRKRLDAFRKKWKI